MMSFVTGDCCEGRRLELRLLEIRGITHTTKLSVDVAARYRTIILILALMIQSQHQKSVRTQCYHSAGLKYPRFHHSTRHDSPNEEWAVYLDSNVIMYPLKGSIGKEISWRLLRRLMETWSD